MEEALRDTSWEDISFLREEYAKRNQWCLPQSINYMVGTDNLKAKTAVASTAI